MSKHIIQISNKDPEAALNEFNSAIKMGSEVLFTKQALAGRTLFNENLLHLAIRQNNKEAVHVLIKASLDPYLKTKSGQNSFEACSNQTDPSITKMLAAYKNKIDVQNAALIYDRMLTHLIGIMRAGQKMFSETSEISETLQTMEEMNPNKYNSIQRIARKIFELNNPGAETFYITQASLAFASGLEANIENEIDKKLLEFQANKQRQREAISKEEIELAFKEKSQEEEVAKARQMVARMKEEAAIKTKEAAARARARENEIAKEKIEAAAKEKAKEEEAAAKAREEAIAKAREAAEKEKEDAIKEGLRSRVVFKHLGVKSVEYQKEVYELLNTKINFAKKSSGLSSVGIGKNREVILVSEADKKNILGRWEAYLSDYKKSNPKPLSIHDYLSLANRFTKNALSKDPIKFPYQDLIKESTELAMSNKAAGKTIKLPNESHIRPAANISDFIDGQCGVCRHHVIVNGIIIGHGVNTGAIPKGDVRQYRDETIDDTLNQHKGPHAVLTYVHDGKIWVVDSLNFDGPIQMEQGDKLKEESNQLAREFKEYVGSAYYSSIFEKLLPAPKKRQKPTAGG